ncbi:MAG: response regulator [Vicinamibacterales bacterium]
MRVLVCDDDPAARFVAKRWLTSALGCNVTDCEDGVRALEILSVQPFDLALIDLDLPRLNGVEVIEAIRGNEETRELPVVVLSQERREEVVRKLVALGVSAYLLKPLRERTVLGRIGPILTASRATRKVAARALKEIRLEADSPALLVDGDQNFRHTFASVAGQFGPVIVAESGADALASYRRSPVSLVFVGQQLGIMGPQVLVKKIREVEVSYTRIVAVGPTEEDGWFDARMGRVFIPDTLTEEIRPFTRLQGPLSALESLAPQFDACLSSAVTQVFGMMGGLEVAPSGDGSAVRPSGIMSEVTVDIDGRFNLHLELVLPQDVADEVSTRLLGCEKDEVDDDARSSTVSELANMVSGRLDAWLKGKSLGSHVTLPATRPLSPGEALQDAAPGAGFAQAFELSGFGAPVLLRGQVNTQQAA